MKRVVIVVSGEVQRVGYRDAVEKIARKLKLVGFVENLKPYDVKIIAEGEEEVLKKFIELIDIKRYPVDVEKVVVRFEEPKGEFEYFEIKRGEWHEELGERLDIAGTYLYKSVLLGERSVALSEKSVALSEKTVELGEKSVKLGEKTVELGEKTVELGERSVKLGEKSVNNGEKMLDKQDQMTGKLDLIHRDLSEKQDKTIELLTETKNQTAERSDKLDDSFHSFHQDTVARFDVVDQKYGKISENMGLIFNEMKKERVESRKSMEKLIGTIVKLAEKK